MSAVGDRIRKLRRSLGLTQEEFAENIGVKGGVVSAWEKGNAPVPYGRVLMLGEAYNVNERWITSGIGEMFATTDKQPGKTPREHAEDYLLSLIDKLPPAARRDAVDFCRLVVRKYDPDYGDGSRR